MAVLSGGQILVSPQTQMIDDALGGHIESLAHCLDDRLHRNLFGSEAFEVDRDRLNNTDGVGKADDASISKASGNNVLGHMASHVGSASVDLGWVLAAEGTAAVGAESAVGVDDDFSTRQTRVTVGAANDELTRGVDVESDFAIDVLAVFGQNRIDDFLADNILDGVRLVSIVLLAENNSVNSHWLVAIVNDRNLALRVGSKS